MTTVVASGSSTNAETRRATSDAVAGARDRLRGGAASFGFVFVGPDHDLAVALEVAAKEAGTEDLIGCTTAGEFTEAGLVHGGVVVMLAAAPDIDHYVRFNADVSDTEAAADGLSDQHREAKRKAFGRDRSHSTVVVLTDALAGRGEDLVDALADKLAGAGSIVGGAAGDEARFVATPVGVPGQVGKSAAAALHVFGSKPWGIGVDHGLRATTDPMPVTKAEGNVVYEIAGRPAFEAYKAHAAKRGVTLTRENAGPYLIGNELGIHVFQRIGRARAPLFVGEDGSLSCAASVRPGSMVSILDGEPTEMVAAARRAAEEAKERLGSSPVAGVVLFDCVCRGMILGERFGEEIAAVRSVFGDVPVAGFLTYGEIARYPGKLSGWHNATAVVVAIPA